MEILIGLVIFIIGLSAESAIARRNRRQEDQDLYECRLARYAGARR
jgi:hypothetical protein